MDPKDDPGVKQIEEAQTEEQKLAVEAALVQQTDNSPREEDGVQPEEATDADG